MSEKELYNRVGEMLKAEREGRYEEALRLENALDSELAEDAVKEERIFRIAMAVGVILFIIFAIIFFDYIMTFLIGAFCFMPFMAEALKNGGNIK